ncbi:formyl transferase [Naematelia encephala]|uniref:methionyl-tRNA formyltransferase n=1 Tax=Naematelia encephala TaxID=71784 RepID=A0A1Y2BLR3_9TREE|nr:formyl transferase [Naematelia encephala]
MILRIQALGKEVIKIQICQTRGFASSSRLRKEPFKILFCGSDEFSVASLKAVYEAKDLWQSIHVLTPHETRVGRGGKNASAKDSEKMYIPALKKYAEELGLERSVMPFMAEVKTPRNVFRKKPEMLPDFKLDDRDGWTPPEPFIQHDPSHLLLTASFGHIIPAHILNLFSENQRLNVHPSLLPRYRGAAPIQWTIANGETETGVSVQRLVDRQRGIDGGELLGVTSGIEVPEDATYRSMLPPLAEEGGSLLVRVLRDIMEGKEKPVPQDTTLKSRAPKIGKETTHIRWREHNALQLDRMHRGMSHQQHLWTELHGNVYRFPDWTYLREDQVPMYLTSIKEADHNPGKAWLDKSVTPPRVLIACVPPGIGEDKTWNQHVKQGHSWAEVKTIWPVGKQHPISVKDWWNGLPNMERKRNWVLFKGRRFLNGEEQAEGE